eukprot:2013803-Prymnesium_polylepis.1
MNAYTLSRSRHDGPEVGRSRPRMSVRRMTNESVATEGVHAIRRTTEGCIPSGGQMILWLRTAGAFTLSDRNQIAGRAVDARDEFERDVERQPERQHRGEHHRELERRRRS